VGIYETGEVSRVLFSESLEYFEPQKARRHLNTFRWNRQEI
jgi:hypothetical protein